jgi:hypothetical protein
VQAIFDGAVLRLSCVNRDRAGQAAGPATSAMPRKQWPAVKTSPVAGPLRDIADPFVGQGTEIALASSGPAIKCPDMSGIVDLFLAAVILAGLPGTVAWALGLIVGINMVFGGASIIGMALAAHAEMPWDDRPFFTRGRAQKLFCQTCPGIASASDRQRLAGGRVRHCAGVPVRLGRRRPTVRSALHRRRPAAPPRTGGSGHFEAYAAQQKDYSITSSARASNDGGTSMPSAFAVLRLITVSYLTGACTGRLPAFSPLRMRST